MLDADQCLIIRGAVAVSKSVASAPSPAAEMSKKALSLAEQNTKASFDHVRKPVHATDYKDAIRIQSEFLKTQFSNVGEQMKQIADEALSAAKDASAGKLGVS